MAIKIGEELIRAGLDRISISCEGTTEEVYGKYRIGGSFKTFLSNIKGFMRLRDEVGSETPLVRIQAVALPELVGSLQDYGRFWGDIVDEVAFIDFKDYSDLKQDLVYDRACPYLWQRMMVRLDGTISVCQFDYTSSYNLGNVNNGDTIRSAWKGEIMEDVREANKKGKSHEIGICNGCSFRTTEILKLMEGE